MNSPGLIPVGVGVGVVGSASFSRGVEGITRKNESSLLIQTSLSRFGAERDRDICFWTFVSKLRDPVEHSSTGGPSEWPTGVTGKDDVVLFPRGVNILVNDHDLEKDGGDWIVLTTAFSVSETVLFLFLKLSFVRRLFFDDLVLDAWVVGDPSGPEEFGVKLKFTFFGVGVGVGGIFIRTNSPEEEDGCNVLDGISKNRFCFLHCFPFWASKFSSEMSSST